MPNSTVVLKGVFYYLFLISLYFAELYILCTTSVNKLGLQKRCGLLCLQALSQIRGVDSGGFVGVPTHLPS